MKPLINALLKLFSPFNVITAGLGALFICYILHIYGNLHLRYILCKPDYWSVDLDNGFEGFDNVSGLLHGPYIVPNYVHYIRYGRPLKEVNFMDAVNILAAFKNQKPDKIMFHTDQEPFTGPYWERLLKIPKFNETIEYHFIQPMQSIFGQPLSSWNGRWHASDVLRIQILRRFGGIFMDNDVYLVQSLDRFRRFETALESIDELDIGTMTLVAHKDSRFMRLWLDEYRDYVPHLWYYNAGTKPKINVINNRPELVHDARGFFGVEDLRVELYVQNWKKWKSKYTIHTLVRHTHDLPALIKNKLGLKYPMTFNPHNILQYNVTIQEMVLDCCKELVYLN